MVSFKELLKLDDEGKKTLVIAIGLAIIASIHAFGFLAIYWAIEYATWDAVVIAIVSVLLGDLIGIGIWIVRVVFKITEKDLDRIKSDDIPLPSE